MRGPDGLQTAVFAMKPGDHGIADKLIDVTLVFLDDFRFDAQHFVKQPNDLFGIAGFGKLAELADVRKKYCQRGPYVPRSTFRAAADVGEGGLRYEREHGQAFSQSLQHVPKRSAQYADFIFGLHESLRMTL